MRFFMMGYTTIWACDQIRDSKPWLAFAAAVLVLACGTTDLIGLFFLGLVGMIFIVDAMLQTPFKSGKFVRGGIFIAGYWSALIYSLRSWN